MGKVMTLAEIRVNIADTTRESEINSLIDDYINLTIQEINDSSWAYEILGIRGINHLWSFLKRKYTLTTVASTEFYQLPRDVDKISLIRQTSSPSKLRYLPDEIFYRYIPNPTAEGNPLYYRLWEEEGIATRLTSADTISVVSSLTTDTSQTVSIVGKDSNGIIVSENLTLNGTTAVSGSQSFAANYPLRVSKSADTAGLITVKAVSANVTILTLGKEERSPRFKIIGLYPIPSSDISVYIEYYTRIRQLVNDTDVPDIDEKWMWVIKLGVLEKVLQYQNKLTEQAGVRAQFAAGIRSMVKADSQNVDYIPILRSHNKNYYSGVVNLSDDVESGFYGEGLGINW